MNILIVHRIAYDKIRYDAGIDHEVHDVVYVGTDDKLKTVPAELRCTRLVREDRGDDICEAVLAALKPKPWRFDRVISLSEYELLEAARLRERLNVPGPSFADTCLVRDKVAMKKAVSAAGIDVPRFSGLHGLTCGDAVRLPWSGKTVLKPTHGAASEDVLIFETATACLEALARRTTGAASLDGEDRKLDSFELEEFVDGAILHIDGLVGDGKVLGAIGSRYVNTCQQFAANRPLGSGQFELDAVTRDWVQRAVDAVRVQAGAFHLEAIESARGIVFLEIANRTGGAGVMQATSLTWDTNFQARELELLVDGRLRNPAALVRRGNYHGWYVFPGHEYEHGHWTADFGLDRFKTDRRAATWFEREPTAAFEDKPDYTLKAAPLAGIVSAERPEEVREFMVELFAAVEWRPKPATTGAAATADASLN